MLDLSACWAQTVPAGINYSHADYQLSTLFEITCHIIQGNPSIWTRPRINPEIGCWLQQLLLTICVLLILFFAAGQTQVQTMHSIVNYVY